MRLEILAPVSRKRLAFFIQAPETWCRYLHMQRNFAMPAQPPRPAAEQLGRAWAEPGLRSAAPPEVYIAPDENAPFPAGRSTLYREYLMKKSGLWESDCLVHGYPETWALPAGRPIEPVGRPPSDDGAGVGIGGGAGGEPPWAGQMGGEAGWFEAGRRLQAWPPAGAEEQERRRLADGPCPRRRGAWDACHS